MEWDGVMEWSGQQQLLQQQRHWKHSIAVASMRRLREARRKAARDYDKQIISDLKQEVAKLRAEIASWWSWHLQQQEQEQQQKQQQHQLDACKPKRLEEEEQLQHHRRLPVQRLAH